MNSQKPNPFGSYRWALVDTEGDLLAQLPVVDLVQGATNGTIEEAHPSYGRRLFEELDRRGRDAWWEAVLLCLDFVANTTVAGQTGVAAAERLRRDAARESRQAGRLLLEMMADHREHGADAAAVVWNSASAAARAEAGRRLFVVACADARSPTAALTPDQMRTLTQQLVIS